MTVHDSNIATNGAIDAHQHFWQYHPVQHSWISDDMAAIRKDFFPADLAPVLQKNDVSGCVAVQADQTETETEFLLQLAQQNDIVKGVVGWVDLRSANLQQRLEHYAQQPLLKGFRHILQGEEPAFMLQPAFLKGIGLLNQYRFTYDILIYPQHLHAATEMVKQFPEQAFVIDHIAKPFIKDSSIDQWEKDITAIAQYPNVHCKVSGMVTEADMRNWKPDNFTPYLNVVTEAFGTSRLMYGSDWPVCLAAASYEQVAGIVRNYFSTFTSGEQQAIFRTNALAFYHLI